MKVRGRYFWQDVVNEWQHSGQSLRQFAEERRIDYPTLCRWKGKLSMKAASPEKSGTDAHGDSAKEAASERSASPFAAVRLVDPPLSEKAFCAGGAEQEILPVIEVVLECGRMVRIMEECEPEFLGRVVSILDSLR